MMAESKRPPAPPGATVKTPILDVSGEAQHRVDLVAAEEPLEIRVVAGHEGGRKAHSIAVTMRTPGHDFELAAGFLFSEGVLANRRQLWRLARCKDASEEAADNIVEAHLAPGVDFDAQRFSRHVYTTSSCGICGKASIERLNEACPERPRGEYRLNSEVIRSLPKRMSEMQTVFARTGGLHAAGLFDPRGAPGPLREDVGRHNAVDKLIGASFLDGGLPLSESVLLVSGRASFELVQKALMAGIPALLAVGAPSSLAVATAQEFGMTLVGFLKADGFNVYSGEERVLVGD
jgi:FdhD protein